MDAATFAQIYIAAQDPRKNVFYMGQFGISGPLLQPQERHDTAISLAKAGVVIDDVIEGVGGDPFLCMTQRLSYGQSRWPSLDQLLAYGGMFPKDFNYNDPSLKIKNSIDPADYPKWTGPIPPVVKYVGLYAGNGLYNVINNPEKVYSIGGNLYEDGLFYTLILTVTGTYMWVLLGKNAPVE